MISGIGNITTGVNIASPSMPGQGGSLTGGQQSGAQNTNFGDVLKDMVITRPTEASNNANALLAAQASGQDVDPHQLAVTTALAGVEIQMATRTISSTVSAIRTLMQTQV